MVSLLTCSLPEAYSWHLCIFLSPVSMLRCLVSSHLVNNIVSSYVKVNLKSNTGGSAISDTEFPVRCYTDSWHHLSTISSDADFGTDLTSERGWRDSVSGGDAGERGPGRGQLCPQTARRWHHRPARHRESVSSCSQPVPTCNSL